MPAKTRWWLCGNCGFANHPRDARRYPPQFVPDQVDPSIFRLVDINVLCEQCGSPASSANSVDVNPESVNA